MKPEVESESWGVIFMWAVHVLTLRETTFEALLMKMQFS